MLDQFLVEALISNDIPVPDRDFRGSEFLRWGKNKRYWVRKFDGGYKFGDFAGKVWDRVFDPNLTRPKKSRRSSTKQADVYHTDGPNTDVFPYGFSEKAVEIYSKATELVQHPYLDKKQVKTPYDLKYSDGKIVVPIHDGEALISLQFIDALGNKKYLAGAKKCGGYFTICDDSADQNAGTIMITEGLATGCSVFEAVGFMTVVAFDAGNLRPVAEKIREKFPESKIIICADNDAYSEKNIGIEKAEEAAEVPNCVIAIPEFKDKTTKPTDFNDLMILEGIERVKEIILQSITQEDQSKDFIPKGFKLTDEGLYYKDNGKNAEKYRISNYVKVTALGTDENGIWGKMVEVKDFYGSIKQIFISDVEFAGTCRTVRLELAKIGLNPDGTIKGRELLNKYLTTSIPKKRITCVSKTGWHFGKIFTIGDKIIGKLDSEVVCNTPAGISNYKKRGSLEDWKKNIAHYCQNNSRLILSVCTAFAAPALDICEVPNGGFHFTGPSSTGKTTCLRVAASVYGDKNYIRSWRTTDNGLENVAANHNDSLLVLDEINQVDPNKVGEIAYMLANGSGKSRATSLGGLAKTKTWQTLFLSSGESSLSVHMGSVKKKTQAGQDIRLLNINASPAPQSFGIFEDLHGFKNGTEFANFLTEKSAKYHGSVIVKLVENLVKNRDSFAEYIAEKMRKFKQIYLHSEATGQDFRVFERFAFVGAVGEYATEKGLTGWGENEAIEGCIGCFNSWLDGKGGYGNMEESKLLDQVKLFLEQNAESKLRMLPADAYKITNMAGYRDDDYYYITPGSFKNVVCQGFEQQFAASVLKKNGWLITASSGGKNSVLKSINSKSVRVYKLDKQAILKY